MQDDEDDCRILIGGAWYHRCPPLGGQDANCLVSEVRPQLKYGGVGMKHTIFIDDNGEKSGFYNIDDGESRINSYYYDIDPTTGTLFTSTEVVEIINDMRKAGICAHAIPSVTITY